jgi:hypothetical protein
VAIFPVSSIHDAETSLSSFGSDLGLVHEMLGDVSLAAVDAITLEHVMIFAEAYLKGERSPNLIFDIDSILEGKRNVWLPDMHVTAQFDASQFAGSLRSGRKAAATEFEALAMRWALEKPSFATVLEAELSSYAKANSGALSEVFSRFEEAARQGDGMALLEASGHPVYREFMALKGLFERHGCNSQESARRVIEFWAWPGLRELPRHRTSSYFFAAIARKMAAGQRRPPTPGTFSDLDAISTYAPFVDVMIVDNECAALLAEEPLKSEISFRAEIYSMKNRRNDRNGESFVQYLEALADAAPAEVRKYAEEIYGIS